MKAEEIDALLGGEAQRIADQYRGIPLDFMDGYGWAVTQICRLFPNSVPVIRCEQCIHLKKFKYNRPYQYCAVTGGLMKKEDYCSRAERKEE